MERTQGSATKILSTEIRRTSGIRFQHLPPRPLAWSKRGKLLQWVECFAQRRLDGFWKREVMLHLCLQPSLPSFLSCQSWLGWKVRWYIACKLPLCTSNHCGYRDDSYQIREVAKMKIWSNFAGKCFGQESPNFPNRRPAQCPGDLWCT